MILVEDDPHIMTQEGKAQVGSAASAAVRKRRVFRTHVEKTEKNDGKICRQMRPSLPLLEINKRKQDSKK